MFGFSVAIFRPEQNAIDEKLLRFCLWLEKASQSLVSESPADTYRFVSTSLESKLSHFSPTENVSLHTSSEVPRKEKSFHGVEVGFVIPSDF